MITFDQTFYQNIMSSNQEDLIDNDYLFNPQTDAAGNFTMPYAENNDVNIPESVVRESKNGFWKYEEDQTLKEIQDYLSSTYSSHYTSKESKTQTLDLIDSIGDAEPFCRSNAIKYLSRFGKKNGKSKQDILKAIHYCILLYHFAGLHKNTSDYPY